MIEMTVETITPQLAAKYLKANADNYRQMSRAKIKQYADDMKAGRWELNGESIQFDRNGILKNGQHRLAAIIMANVPINMTVMRGVDESVTVYDLHKMRTAHDIANARGLNASKEVVCAANLLLFLKSGKTPTRTEVADFVIRHEDELNRAKRCLPVSKFKHLGRASIVLSVYLMLQTNKMPFYECEVFFQAFATEDETGTDGYEVSPAFVARRMFKERWAGSSNQRTQREQMDVLIQAMSDMHLGHKRTNNYKISQPFSYEPLLKSLEGAK